PLNSRLLEGDTNGAYETASTFKDIFGPERFYVEIQDHGIAEQERTNPELIRIAKELELPLVATNDSHYLLPDDRDTQDVMICIQTGRKLHETNRMHAYTEHHYLKTPEEMINLFKDYPEAISNTAKVADMVDFDPDLNAFHFPEFKTPDGTHPNEYLRREAREKLDRMMNGMVPEKYARRLDYELDVISKMGFASYFLIVADFVGWAKRRGILVGPGRGSAAGSLVSFSLGITGIDPLEHNLVFERFLNPARSSPPDIDIDFDPDGRAEVINYVTELYGAEHVCQIITFNRFKARAAIRDVGRVMDIPLGEVDKMAKLVPWNADLDEAISKSPEFKEAYDSNQLTKEWIDNARKIEGLTRNASVHAAGVIICRDPIWMHAPVQKMEGESASVCMYSMNDAEKVGLVKMDFLGLRTLTYLQETCDLVRANHGVEIHLDKIPLTDDKTFKLLSSGDVMGVFQMEGVGMRDLLMAIAPDRLEDIIATIALYRPGPMENDLHNKYARRKRGREERSVRHPIQQDILEPTYGVLTYQEQISHVLQAMGGIDLANSTLVMKLISKKKDRERIALYKNEFLVGAQDRGVDRDTAKAIWSEMEAFAGYGFNKAHAAAYGIISYQTAYLKANYPVEFYAAYLTSEIHNTEKIAQIIDEMKRKKIPVYPPDVNASFPKFIVENDGVRYGLAAIKGVGTHAVESIVESRSENGKFEDLFQMTEKIDLRLVNKGVLEALIRSGACDTLNGSRAAMDACIQDALDHGKRLHDDAERGQVGLFMDGTVDNTRPSLPDIPESQIQDLLKMEKASLGFFLSHHPLDDVWDDLKQSVREKISDLKEMKDGRTVRIGGMLASVSKRISRKMQNFALITIEDRSGRTEGIVFPQTFEKVGHLLDTDAFVVIKGRLRIDDPDDIDADTQPVREVQVIVEELWQYNPDAELEEDKWTSQGNVAPEKFYDVEIMLDDFPSAASGGNGWQEEVKSVEIKVDMDSLGPDAVMKLGSFLSARKGKVPVRILFNVNNREIVVNTGESRRIDYSTELREALLNLPGVLDVSAKSTH
ncbi:MAG TPA: DNA polymerase III subunit alpha, partial [bacterium]